MPATNSTVTVEHGDVGASLIDRFSHKEGELVNALNVNATGSDEMWEGGHTITQGFATMRVDHTEKTSQFCSLEKMWMSV